MSYHQPELFGNTSISGSVMKVQATSPNLSAVPGEELLAETDEPPDEGNRIPSRGRVFSSFPSDGGFGKTRPSINSRKTSLLTQALHTSEEDSHDDEITKFTQDRRISDSRPALGSTSITSSAELTSDGGMTSSGTRGSTPSPPLPPTNFQAIVPLFDKEPLDAQDVSEKGKERKDASPVEQGLGRKRCIKFACTKDPKVDNAMPPAADKNVAEAPRRPCALKFVCPFKAPSEELQSKSKAASPPATAPPAVRKVPASPRASSSRRGSSSLTTTDSPRHVRRASLNARQRKNSDNSDLGRNPATRFHEFASSEEEIDEWVQESTCHRSRLTINDTLSVENGLRQLTEEVDEEALEEEDEEEAIDALSEKLEERMKVADDDDDDDDDVDDDDEDEDEDEDDEDEGNGSADDVSDEGFQTDDEHGFAGSDDDSSAGSDYEWWVPGRSTGATSADLSDHLRPSLARRVSDSSVGSSGSHRVSPHSKSRGKTSRQKSKAVDIRPGMPDLPDSTDFVCGTLDEDRPLEDAYLSCLEQRRMAKHKATPQDIDPTFPTSDPELDEEDEVDDVEATAEESDQHLFMHGQLDPHDAPDMRGRRAIASKKRSPLQSPKRMRSPPPLLKRVTSHRSPPPRRLHGQSPKRLRSPPPPTRLRSPPPTHRTSLALSPKSRVMNAIPGQLASRPALTHTRSLPRTPSLFRNLPAFDREDVPDDERSPGEFRRRGAIDIFKGLEKKRQHRREKLYQKYCRKAGKARERRPQPGKGAERMREMGLELAACKGKCPRVAPYDQTHIISY